MLSLFARALAALGESLLGPTADEINRLEWKRALTNRRILWPQDATFRREYADLGNRRAAAFMDLLADLLREEEIQLGIAVYPRRVQVYYGDLDSLQVKIWKRWASRRGVPILDFFPCFIGSDPWQEVVERNSIPGDAHWNVHGHRRVADGFLRFWREGKPPCPE